MRQILLKKKANFKLNAARSVKDLMLFCDKRQAVFRLVILDDLLKYNI